MAPRVGRLLLIVAAGGLLGLVWNGLSGRGFPLSANVLVKPGDELAGPPEVSARAARGALVLDARPLDFYKMGHLPGALSLPEDDFDVAFARLEPALRSSLDVVVYCAQYCEASHIVARKLKERGIPAAILKDGYESWTDAGLATRTGAQP